jgi:hypothetical protein
VSNETPFANVQYLHPINEDTDFETHVFKEGEATKSPTSWDGDEKPESAWMQKGNGRVFLSSTASPDTSAWPSAVASDVASDNESEIEIESDTQPQPPESGDEVRSKHSFISAFDHGFRPPAPPPPEPVIPARPSWWAAPWEKLEQEALPGTLLIPQVLCPLQFKELATSDIRAIDMYRSETEIDPVTGEKITGREGYDLFHGVTGVVSSDEYVTLSRSVGYNCNDENMLLANAAAMMSLVPQGQLLALHTCSSWLATEFQKMIGHVECQFSGKMSWDEVPPEWKKILEYVQNKDEVSGISIKNRQESQVMKISHGTT